MVSVVVNAPYVTSSINNGQIAYLNDSGSYSNSAGTVNVIAGQCVFSDASNGIIYTSPTLSLGKWRRRWRWWSCSIRYKLHALRHKSPHVVCSQDDKGLRQNRPNRYYSFNKLPRF